MITDLWHDLRLCARHLMKQPMSILAAVLTLALSTGFTNDLKLGQSQGQIALWLGPGTVAHFADLRVSK